MRIPPVIKLFFMVLSLVSLAGCIRDKIQPCPPLTFTLYVEDKNYANIESVSTLGLAEKRPEDLPFKDYVGNLYLRLTNVATGTVVLEEALAELTESTQTLSYTLPADLPFGTYSLVVWGNVSLEDCESDLSSVWLHPDNVSGDDVYLASKTLEYNELTYDYTVGMKRTKGKLMIEVQDMPADFRCHTASMDEVWGHLAADWNYSSPVALRDTVLWKQGGHVVTHTILAPSTARNNTVLDVRFHGDTQPTVNDWLSPELIRTSIYRNEITLIRYVYDPCCCRFFIYVLINDHWESLHSMEIT